MLSPGWRIPEAERTDGPRESIALPLGLQYIFTSQCCRMFAAAFAAHSAGSGLKPVEIWGLSKGSTDPEFFHIALQDGAGMLVDAEGRRDPDTLFRDFGLAMRKPSLREAAEFTPDKTSEAGQRIRRVLTLCGWDRAVPLAADVKTATSCWEHARDEFIAKDGWTRTPSDLLDEYETALLKARCETVGDVVRIVIRDWVADLSRPQVDCPGHLTMGPCEEWACDVEEALKRRFGTTLEVTVMNTDEVAAAQVYKTPSDYHAFLRVGSLYYDAARPEGVASADLLPLVSRILQIATETAEERTCEAPPERSGLVP